MIAIKGLDFFGGGKFRRKVGMKVVKHGIKLVNKEIVPAWEEAQGLSHSNLLRLWINANQTGQCKISAHIS